MSGSVCTFAKSPNAPNGRLTSVLITWTSDDSNGTVTGTSVFEVNGLVYGLTTNPGATAPTDNYDITITDEDGVDLLGGAAADRDTSNSEYVAAKDGGGNVVPIPCGGPITFNGSNMGNSKIGTARLWFLPL